MKTNLITPKGYHRLNKELTYLWKEYRPEITKKVTWAASLGDRSENADYKENKRILRQIDSRVRYLRKRLESVKIIEPTAQQEGRIFFGAFVEVENEDEETLSFQIVGPDEIFGNEQACISIDSPMARALLKKEIGDDVVVQTPTGDKIWYVLDIKYINNLDT